MISSTHLSLRRARFCGTGVTDGIFARSTHHQHKLESGIIYGLSAALWGDITLRSGRVQQRNFNEYRVLRLNETPEIEIHIVPSNAAPGAIGETGVPPVAPAVCNAIFAATGKRLRRLPIAAYRLA